MDSVELRLLIFYLIASSGASYLMPELSTELAGATSQAGFAEIDGVGSTVTRTIFSQSERLAQRATYEASRYAIFRIINCPIEGIFKEICMSRWTQ
jgi:hypothetical protein